MDSKDNETSKSSEDTYFAKERLSIFSKTNNLLSVETPQEDLVYTVTNKLDIEKILSLIGKLELSKLNDMNLLPTSAPGSPLVDDGIRFIFKSHNEKKIIFDFTNNNGNVILEYIKDNNPEYYVVDKYIGKELFEILETGEKVDLNHQ